MAQASANPLEFLRNQPQFHTDASDHPAEPGAAASAPAAARSRQPAAPAGGWSLAQSRCDWTHNAESCAYFLCSKSAASGAIRADVE